MSPWRPKRLSLPSLSLMSDATRVREFVAAFEAIVKEAALYLGAKEVRGIVGRVTKLPRGKKIDQIRALIRAYDVEAVKGPVNLSALARRLYQQGGREYGQSAQAIEKRLRRILAARKLSSVAEQRRRERLGRRPTSVLGSDK